MKRLKQLIKSWPVIGPAIAEAYRFIMVQQADVTGQIARHFVFGNELFFVQIGSNDGRSGDPVYDVVRHDPRWRGILVEPVPSVFRRLKSNYENDSRFIFENVAITDDDGFRSFYSVSETAKQSLPELPAWLDHLSSFDKELILKFDPRLEPHIQELQVRCKRLSQLLEGNSVGRIDLLHIDAEGHDWAILRQLDLSKHLPSIILFEQCHLSEEDRSAAIALLGGKFRIKLIGRDCLCVRKSCLDFL